MIFGWLRRRRRKKLLATPLPAHWPDFVRPFPFYERLTDEERERLFAIARVIVAEKHWEGCAGLELTEEMQVVVSAQAALLLLEIEHDYYKEVRSILLFPRSYKTPFPKHGPGGVMSEGGEHLGEAWYRGPVILAWDWVRHGAVDPKDGQNLVLHEFAHRLDFRDGWIDGTPRLKSKAEYARWAEVMAREYEDLREAAQRGRKHVLDRYGATDPAEFFAVITETFFEKPKALARKHAELYDVLRSYFRQDPLARLAASEDDDED